MESSASRRGELQSLVLIVTCLTLAIARSHWGTAVVLLGVGIAAVLDRVVNARVSLALSWPLYVLLLAVTLSVVAIW